MSDWHWSDQVLLGDKPGASKSGRCAIPANYDSQITD
jgi:hypothetical protein